MIGGDENTVTLSWLTMLGWRVRTELEGGVWAGVASRFTESGEKLTVGACATSRRDVIWELFFGAIDQLERPGAAHRLPLAA